MTDDGAEQASKDNDGKAGTMASSTGILIPTQPEFPIGGHLS